MTALTITLPWPATALWPNRNYGESWKFRQAPKKLAKELGYYEAKQFGVMLPLEVTVPVIVTFHARTKRRFDLGGGYLACKGYEDGIAAALGIDDYYFAPVLLRRGEPEKPGKVVFQIG